MSTLLTCTSSTRPGSPAAGDTLFETDTNKVIVYSGTAWKEYQDNGQLYDDSDITTLSPHLWLDAQNGDFYKDTGGSTAASTDGDRVALWKDRSGNAFDFSVSGGYSLEPVHFKYGLINRSCLTFAADHLNFTGTASSDLSGDVTVFYVARITYTSGKYIFTTSDASTRMRLLASGDNIAIQALPFAGSPTFQTSYTTANTAKINEDILIFTIRTDRTANTCKMFFNGGSAVGSTTAGSGNFLKNGANSELPDNGATESPFFIFDFLVFDSALSASNMDTVCNYFSQKYSVAVDSVTI